LKLCIKALKKFLDSNFTIDRIDAAYIDEKEKKMKKVSRDRLKKLM